MNDQMTILYFEQKTARVISCQEIFIHHNENVHLIFKRSVYMQQFCLPHTWKTQMIWMIGMLPGSSCHFSLLVYIVRWAPHTIICHTVQMFEDKLHMVAIHQQVKLKHKSPTHWRRQQMHYWCVWQNPRKFCQHYFHFHYIKYIMVSWRWWWWWCSPS